MIRVGSIVIRVDGSKRQLTIWSATLDYVRRDDSDVDFVMLRPRVGNGPNLALDMHASQAPIAPRIHLDLYADQQAAEVARLLALGTTEIHWDKRPLDADHVILRDPEGNRFCVVDAAQNGQKC